LSDFLQFSHNFSRTPPIIRYKWTVINNILSFNYTAESFHVHDNRMHAATRPLRFTVFISFLVTHSSVQNEKLLFYSVLVFSHPSSKFAQFRTFSFDASIGCSIVSVITH